MALGFWRHRGENRSRILALQGAYHGDTIGGMSVGERGVFNAPYDPLLFDVDRLPFPSAGREQATLDAFPPGLVIGASRPAGSLREVRDAFREAREVADVAARNSDGTARRLYYRLPDLRLRGLLHLLRENPRLRSFVDRELGPLLSYDAEHGTTLVSDLAAFLESGGNKALAAARAHLARPTFYQRLALIERILGVSLADPESRASLHVALLARREGR